MALVVIIRSARGAPPPPPPPPLPITMCGVIATLQASTGIEGGGDNDDSPPGRRANVETEKDGAGRMDQLEEDAFGMSLLSKAGGGGTADGCLG